jgi:HD-GYP domain-containing protein (c-di-GMP phosphodiesterase class II)
MARRCKLHRSRADAEEYRVVQTHPLVGSELLRAWGLDIAAEYVAMTLDRPYRRALSPEQAQGELRRHSGTQFDAAVVEALLEHARAHEVAA